MYVLTVNSAIFSNLLNLVYVHNEQLDVEVEDAVEQAEVIEDTLIPMHKSLFIHTYKHTHTYIFTPIHTPMVKQ